MPSDIETLIAVLSAALDNLNGPTRSLTAQAMEVAQNTERQAAVLGVTQVAAALSAAKEEISTAAAFLHEAAEKVESARNIAATLPT